MISPLSPSPSPDFAKLVKVLKGELTPDRVHFVELGIDLPILKEINNRFIGEPWVEWESAVEQTAPELVYRQLVMMFYRLGYDFAPIGVTWPNHPQAIYRLAPDTADLPKSQRKWTEEGWGLIRSWDDFERFPWDAIQPDLRPYEYAARHLPHGMKLVAKASYFEHIFERLLGLEGMSFLMVDAPELVEQVFDRWGQKVYSYYEAALKLDAVGGIFHADDMGHKTSTLVSPSMLRRLVLPWHQKFAELAHRRGKVFFLHSCGNLYRKGIIEDLIEVVKIDGFHSFQDSILPVTDFKAKYGNRVATMGGVDIDRLVRLPDGELRAYLRNILETCMVGGRFALGSGNSVANYVPLEQFCIMLDEGRRWHC